MIGRSRFCAALYLAAFWVVSGLLAQGSELLPNPKTHWSFQPIRDSLPPSIRNASWPKTPVDRFILSELESRGLRPSSPVGRRELLRRVTFDLIGLPPTWEEVARFESDSDPRAFERIVDQLLTSPHYGERWGRWWLDVARYADTNGQDENKVMANAWRYRDWVIEAFNRNLPIDLFITQQLAGDLLPTPAKAPDAADAITATGFLVLGPKMLAEQDKPKLMMDIIDEQIDTVGRAFLGLTLGCARCHDHKYDPIPTRDYYALAGVFKSTRTMENLAFVSKFHERVIAPPDKVLAFQDHQKRLADLTQRIANSIRDANAALLESWKPDGPKELPKNPRSLYPEAVRAAITEWECEKAYLQGLAPPPLEMALGVAESSPTHVPVHLRGNHLKLAQDVVPRGFLRLPNGSPSAPIIPDAQSGRLELARWMTDSENPLTTRVFVNRVWQAHFGEGLVRTPDNFGLRGETPSHPALLDWLATEFRRSGWDLKALHRVMVLSAAYQQSTRKAEAEAESEESSPSDRSPGSGSVDRIDPDNRWLSYFPRRRLDAEMIRDGILHVSGRLDPTRSGSLVEWKNDEYTPGDTVSAVSVRRTIYLPIVRDRVYDALTLFDFANPSVTTAKRVPTVVAQQALFFMNSTLVKDSALALARSIGKDPALASSTRIRTAFLRVLGRPPTPAEATRAIAFLKSGSGGNEPGKPPVRVPDFDPFAELCQALLASNEFVYRP